MIDALAEGGYSNDLSDAIFSGDDICPRCFGDLEVEPCAKCGFRWSNPTASPPPSPETDAI